MQNLAQHYQKISGQPKLHRTLLQKQNNWMPIIPVLLRQRQMALSEFKVRLVYTVSLKRQKNETNTNKPENKKQQRLRSSSST